MHSWSHPSVPALPTPGIRPQLRDTATGTLIDPANAGVASLYVCGITPYDSTHLGHAFTYVAFDTLNRVWRDAGVQVTYAQNVTDIDDPLLERADQDGIDWRELAESQVDLFRGDMHALRVVPPEHFIGVVESMDLVVDAVQRLLAAGAAYWVDKDVYADLSVDERFGSISHLDTDQMMDLFPERGGDPQRAGKRDPLDPLLWLGQRAGEPSWDGGSVGPGRPGWHIECGAIAAEYLGLPVSVEAGGQDLIFPHHDMGTSHLRFLAGTGGSEPAASSTEPAKDEEPIACYLHSGLVAYQGEKMSKSLGNLVFVSSLIDQGVDPRAIRLVLLNHHYRHVWEYTAEDLAQAQQRLHTWLQAARQDPESANGEQGPREAAVIVQHMRQALAEDLDTPSCLQVVDAAAGTGPLGPHAVTAVDALLGIDLRS